MKRLMASAPPTTTPGSGSPDPVAFVRVELDGEAAYVARGATEPRSPATVEKRTNTGVRLPAFANGAARVTFAIDS